MVYVCRGNLNHVFQNNYWKQITFINQSNEETSALWRVKEKHEKVDKYIIMAGKTISKRYEDNAP